MNTSNKPTWNAVKARLQTYEPRELIELFGKLWKDLPEGKLWLINSVLADADISAEIERYRKIIGDRFFPARGMGDLKLSLARKAVNDFAKTNPPPTALADLMLFYVEQGTAFTASYGDINEAFYSSLLSMFASLVTLINENGESVYGPLADRLETLQRKSQGFGWGFSDGMAELFGELDGDLQP